MLCNVLGLNARLLAAEYYSPFLGIEKGAVLQEARVFHDPQLDARRCCQVRLPNPILIFLPLDLASQLERPSDFTYSDEY